MTLHENYFEELLKLRRWLHQHPELSMQEYETSRFIYEYLTDLGISCRRTGDTGVIATLYPASADEQPDRKYRTVAIRAEIDALPIPEQTGLPFASIYPGMMHACGHDGITAVALCLAKVLSEHRNQLRCNVRFLFEPGEETGEGAEHMMAHGALEDPKVDEILVFHYGNQDPRGMEIQQSISTAAIGGMRIYVYGKSSHWFQPEEGCDAIYAAARLTVEIRRLNQRLAPIAAAPSADTASNTSDTVSQAAAMHSDISDTASNSSGLHTIHPFVLGFGLQSAGTAGNIMADTSWMQGSLRAFTKEDYQLVLGELKRIIRQVEEETGANIVLDCPKQIPPIINDPALVKKGAAIGAQLLGSKFSLGTKPFLVGDNAAYYMEKVPGLRTVFLAGKEGEAPFPVHNPKFDFDEQAMADALGFLYAMVTTADS